MHSTAVVHTLCRLLFCAIAACAFKLTSYAAPPRPGDWPSFRGPDRSGIAPAGNENVPLEWSDTRNIFWKAALPGRGASSPIIWGDSVYLTAYSGYGLEKDDVQSNMAKLTRHLICVDRKNGAIRWKTDRGADPDRSEHSVINYLALHGYASSTPVADDLGVYVHYGVSGVIAYDHNGRERWHTPLGTRSHSWGSASSPILYENLVIVHSDIESGALVALDRTTGKEVWRVATDDPDSWSTPLIVKSAGRDELVFHHTQGEPAKISAVNPRTGAPLWNCSALKDYLSPSPVAAHGITYWLGYKKAAAIRGGGNGDVTTSHLLWSGTRGSTVCTPIIHDGHLYFANEESGLAYCLDLATGKPVYQERLDPPPGRMYASGILVKDRIYYVSREKGTYVVEAKPKFRQLAHNVIASDPSVFNATPAVSRGHLFLRSDKYLYCIGAK